MLDLNQVRNLEPRAALAVTSMVNDLEDMIKDKPELAVFFGNVALAAATVIFERHGITRSQFGPIYEAAFTPVQRELARI